MMMLVDKIYMGDMYWYRGGGSRDLSLPPHHSRFVFAGKGCAPKKLKHFTFQSLSRMPPANSRSELLISPFGFLLVDIHVMVSGSKADFQTMGWWYYVARYRR